MNYGKASKMNKWPITTANEIESGYKIANIANDRV